MEKFKNKKIAIVGFGVEGQSVCDFFGDTPSSIVVFDEKKRADFDQKLLNRYEEQGVAFCFGKIEKIEDAEIIFRSPGFHPDAPFLTAARKNGIEVTSATKVFFDLCPCPIIGVTGTKGKGTTSTLIYEMLKSQSELDTKDDEPVLEAVYLGGNIGIPPLRFLNKLTADSKVVLELSSFQLMDLEKSPHIGVMLMTTSEHLDYHKDVFEYIEAKRNIFKHQNYDDFAIVNRDYLASNESDIHSNGTLYGVSREREVDHGCYVKDEKVFLKLTDQAEEIMATDEIALPGKHNFENVCAAIIASLSAGATLRAIVPVVKTFKGLEHRIEFVALVRGVKYYNDSFSTTPETAVAAIEAFEQPKILILGGSSKNSDFAELGQTISDSNSIRAIIGIGEEWEKIKSSIKNYESRIMVYEDCKNMNEVVQKCVEIGQIGDVVLLSPACASFGLFENYKDRGEQFKESVNALRKTS